VTHLANACTVEEANAILDGAHYLGAVNYQPRYCMTAPDGKAVAVDSPDSITIIGRMVSGAEVSVSVATAPSNPSGNRLEIYGREGAIVIRANGALSQGPNQLHAGRGKDALAIMPVPDQYKFVPNGTPTGQPYNVAQAYARAAGALRGSGSFDVDFHLAVRRHKLIDAIERSAAEGRSVTLGQ